MARDKRLELVKKVEGLRDSRVISVVMGDRPGMETRIAPDLVPVISRHLRRIGQVERIDIFLYTLGGDIVSAFRVVGLAREYCQKLSVLVPFRCQSAGTLMALGADEVLMLAEGQLSPVDPSTNGPYNPTIPGMPIQPGQPLPVLPVSVEEVVGYISLAREIGGIQGEESMTAVFERLTADIRPLALGQVFRARTQIRMLSRKLLQLHMDHDDAAIDTIIETLTEKLYSHDYLINRREAKQMGLKILAPEPKLEDAVFELYEAYESDLQLRDQFTPIGALAGRPQARVVLDRAFVESIDRLDSFQTDVTFAIANGQLTQQAHHEGWRTIP